MADDQRVVREGLVTLLGLVEGIEVVGAAGDGEQAVRMAGRLPSGRRPHGPPDAAPGRRRGDPPDRVPAAGEPEEIARRLFVSEATVKTHIDNIFSKAGLRDRAQAVTYAFRMGLAAARE